MKKVMWYSNYTSDIVTVPTCDTCTKKKSRLEMVSPDVSGTVEYCRAGLELAYPNECPQYSMTLREKLANLCSLL